MIDNLRSMAVFAHVAESGSFRRAAERLGLSASVVSHHVTQLEKELGVRLLYRSTRHVALTDQGSRFFEACRTMVGAAEAALSELHDEQVNGRLWIVAPAMFSVGPFVDDVAEFSHLHPNVEIRLEFDDALRHLIKEGIDVALHVGALEDSSLICRKLFSRSPGLFASPSGLARFGKIETIDDLQCAPWIEVPNLSKVTLYHPDGRKVDIAPKRRVGVNNVIALHQLVLAGIGVAQLPPLLAAASHQAGRLVQLLTEWQLEDVSCYALYPSRAMPNSLARRFVDFIVRRMQTFDAARHQNEFLQLIQGGIGQENLWESSDGPR